MPVAGISLVWAKPQDCLHTGVPPESRCCHTLTLLPKEYKCHALLFGGRDMVSGRHCNDMYMLDIGDLTPPRRGAWQWTMLTVKPTVAGCPGRREARCVVVCVAVHMALSFDCSSI